ncbi:MAG: PrgI family protein [Patescibacteria group bacterium]
MEYQVPQFIEVEDKIFGPFTLKQFIYLAGGAGLCTIFVLYLPLFLGIALSIPVAALSAALAFYKINNKSFIEIIEAGVAYYSKGKLYLWKKDASPKVEEVAPVAPPVETRQKLGLSQNKLRELAWSLDIKDQQDAPK